MKKDEEYTALISPDAYSYLDDTPEDELLHDELLEEQERLEDLDFPDEEPEAEENHEDDSQMDDYGTLFDSMNRSLISSLMSFISDTSDVFSYFASCNDKMRKEIEAAIRRAEEVRKIDGKDKMFAIPDTAITVSVVAPKAGALRQSDRLKTVAAVMVAKGQDSRSLLSVAFAEDGSVEKAETYSVTKDIFTDNEWKLIEKLAERFK